METYVFDGSLEGLLTAIFESFERRSKRVILRSHRDHQPDFFDTSVQIVSDRTKADRVWKGLEKKLGKSALVRFYKCFLSEDADTFQHLFDFVHYVYEAPKGAEKNYGHPSVIALTQMERSVNRERHRMQAFIRFQETSDGIFYAPIEPDFNVLPLISDFFKNRFADQQWLIYDIRRNYGLFYDKVTVTEVVLDTLPSLNSEVFLSEDKISQKENLYGLLWKEYFKSTNIPARKNMKLHLRHVPKRYWKYLTEKQVGFSD